VLVVQSNIFYFTFNFLLISEIVPNLVPNMLLVKTLSKFGSILTKFWPPWTHRVGSGGGPPVGP